MIRSSPSILLGLSASLWLGACRPSPEERARPVPVNTAELAPGRMEPTGGMKPVGLAPPALPLLPEALKGEPGARAVLQRWSGALERGDWAMARGQWGHGGADSGLDPATFARAWQRYQKLAIDIGGGDVEGGAGSLYYDVPVTIDGTLRDGRVQRLSGHVTLRRVNDVDGSSEEDRRWHITQSALEPVP